MGFFFLAKKITNPTTAITDTAETATTTVKADFNLLFEIFNDFFSETESK